jgi:5-formyltetrahydrofolate cyclo-ligase
MASSGDLRHDKAIVRQEMRAMRDALGTPLRRTAASRTTRNLAEMLADGRVLGTLFGVYAAIGSEVDVSPLAAALRAAGLRTAYPRIGTGRERVLDFCLIDDEAALVPGEQNIPAPARSAPALELAQIDVFLVPALAVSPDGHRIGYGGGYYDATLAAAPRAIRIAPVYEVQVIPGLPSGPGDAVLDWLIADERGAIRVLPGRKP